MVHLDPRQLKQTAGRRLESASYKPQTLMLLHTGAALGVSLLITLLNAILDRQIDNTAGLSGLQTRTMLESARTLLQYGASFALPFWEIGILYVALRWARGETAAPSDLPEGFRRFGVILRKMLLEGLILFVIGMACAYLSTGVYMMTPFSQPLMEVMLPLIENTSVLNQQIVLDEAAMAAAIHAMLPVFGIFAVIFSVIAIPLLYRLRLADYVLMDSNCPGALAALKQSFRMTKGSVLQLLRLDISFWWFYLLQILLTVIGFGDVVLTRLGILLPVSADIAFWGFYLVQLAGQLVLFWRAGSRVQTTYALAYDALRQVPEASAVQAPPAHQPWDYT